MARAGGVVSGRLSAVEADWRLCARHQDPAELGVARGDAQVAGPQLVLVSLEPEELAGFLLGANPGSFPIAYLLLHDLEFDAVDSAALLVEMSGDKATTTASTTRSMKSDGFYNGNDESRAHAAERTLHQQTGFSELTNALMLSIELNGNEPCTE